MEIPQKALAVIETLNKAGFEAYVVGGCVRDILLGRTAADWDITTNASPQQVKKLFFHTIDTGIAHGTVTVMIEREGFEVTTYRIDGLYKDGRHPENVTFTGNLSDDLRRRDFTINAMAYHPREGLVDLFGGQQDLKDGIIRCVGDPKERFLEDGLRMMRAVRFSAQLGFCIEKNTFEAIGRLSQRLSLVSCERIQSELLKLLLSDHPGQLEAAYESGLTQVFLKGFGSLEKQERIKRIEALERLDRDRILRLAAVINDYSSDSVYESDWPQGDAGAAAVAASVLKQLKFDNDTINAVKKLAAWNSIMVYSEDKSEKANQIRIRYIMSRLGSELFEKLIKLKAAFSPERAGVYARIQEISEHIQQRGDCLSLKQLAVSGDDLKQYGIKPGKDIGECLRAMLMEVIETPEKNSREYLLKKAEQTVSLLHDNEAL